MLNGQEQVYQGWRAVWHCKMRMSQRSFGQMTGEWQRPESQRASRLDRFPPFRRLNLQCLLTKEAFLPLSESGGMVLG